LWWPCVSGIGHSGQLELKTVEPRQPLVRSQPKIAVLRLCDGIDAVRRQILPLRPRLAVVLINTFGGIKSKAANRTKNAKQFQYHQPCQTKPPGRLPIGFHLIIRFNPPPRFHNIAPLTATGAGLQTTVLCFQRMDGPMAGMNPVSE
jgi:hypothetical protein